MEKSFESSSDSDSNSSSSWVFVSNNATSVENTNTFHLDCSHEPIQELTENDLVSLGSDIESDTDGVSVISESDTTNENCEATSDLLDKEQISSNTDDDCEPIPSDMFIPKKIEKTLITESKKFFRNSKIVGVGVVLTAVFLGSCTLVKKITNLQSQNFIVCDCVDQDAHSKFVHDANQNLENELEQIAEIAVACTYKDREENVVQSKKIKKCIKTWYQTKVLKSVMQHTDTFLHGNNEAYTDDKVYNKIHQNTKIFKSKHNKKSFNRKDVGNHKINECKTKRDKEKHNYLDHLVSKQTNKKSAKLEKIKKQQSDRRHHETYHNRNNNSHLKFKHYNISNKKNHTLPDGKLENNDKSGEWYSNLHKVRQQLRKNNDVNGWHRKNKYKDLWYFKWMNGREVLRYKKNYRPYSRSLNI